MVPNINFIFCLLPKANSWVRLFLSLSDKEDGYSKANITPYMHLLVYHVPKFLCDDDGFKIFTGQGVEKTNDVVRSVYHRKCNKQDGCKESLLALKRIDSLREHEKAPSTYTKRDDTYWTEKIVEERRKRPRLSEHYCKYYIIISPLTKWRSLLHYSIFCFTAIQI